MTRGMSILLIAYYFPPYNSVGAVRAGKLAKFLRDQGHTVQVVTAESPAFPIGLDLEIPSDCVHPVRGWSVNAPIQWLLGGRKRVATQGYRSGLTGKLSVIGTLYKTLFHWPDAEVGWIGAAIAKGRTLLDNEKFDIIYASAPPFSGLFVAKYLSKEFDIPWIAEFRDLWTQNHAYAYPNWRLQLEQILERNVLRSARLLVTVSKTLAEALKPFNKPIAVVRNGFDPIDHSEANNDEGDKAFDKLDQLNISYTGNVYPGFNDVDLLCEGILDYVSSGGKIKITVAGRNISGFYESARRFGIFDHFDFLPTIERQKALQLQLNSDALILFGWIGKTDGVLPVKFFEYAATKRPILVVGPKAIDTSRLVVSEGFGEAAETPGQISAFLQTLMEKKQSNKTTKLTGTIDEAYTRSFQFKLLVTEMLSVVGLNR